MCLLFGMTHTNSLTRKQLNAVLKTVNKLFAPSQQDGFGFAIQNQDGTRYIERFVKPSQFRGIGIAEEVKAALPSNLKPAILNSVTGELRQWGGGMIVHGRTSTNNVSLTNTHPFTKGGWTLAHNGIVSWHGEKHPTETTCDTEHILNMFALGKGLDDIKDLSGYAACLMLTPEGDFAVLRDDHAPLVFAAVPKLNTVLFATKETTIRAVCAALRVRVRLVTEVADDVFLRFPSDPSKDAGYTIEKHSGIRWGTGLGAGACRAFGWGRESDYNWEEYDPSGGHWHKHPDGSWRSYPAPATKPPEKSPSPEEMTDAEWQEYVAELELEREKEEQASKQIKSLHTMTDEELARYGL